MTHGLASSYRRGCKCSECRAAHAERIAGQRARRRTTGVDDWAMHGRLSTYHNWGCKCADCTRASRDDRRMRRAW